MLKGADLDLTKLSDNVFICGLCWKNRTEIMSQRNNIHDLNTWLRLYHGDRYMIYRFGTKINEDVFTNVQEWDMPEFDICKALSMSKSVQGWLSLDKKNICIFEAKGNISKFLFLMSAICRYNRIFDTCQIACNNIINSRYKKLAINCKTLNRYLKYFEEILNKQNLLDYSVSRLKQIIISKIPKMNEMGCDPEFKVFCNNVDIKAKNTKFLIDENYIIANFADVVLNGDIKIQLYHIENGNHILVFEISFNSLFLKQGIHRFEISDILFPFSESLIIKKIGEGFLVDVILIEDDSNIRINYNTESTLIGNLQVLSEHLKAKEDIFTLRILIQDGFNRTLSKLFLQLGYNIDEVKKIIQEKSKYDKNLIINKKRLGKLQNIDVATLFNKSSEKINEIKGDMSIQLDKCQLTKPFQKRDYLEREWCESVDLEMLPDKIEFTNSEKIGSNPILDNFQKNSKVTKGPPKRINNTSKENETILTTKKSLHWEPLSSIKDTFFTKLDDINIAFDKSRFEEWFCELATSTQRVTKTKRQKSIIMNENRIFLISISLKTLEKKMINIHDLSSVILNKSFDLEIDDLESILRILPTDEEIEIFDKYIKENSHPDKEKMDLFDDLNESEKFLISQKEYPCLRKIVEILIFERRLADEKKIIRKNLLNIKSVYNNILESFHLLTILKAVLDLGNLINYKYSRNRFRRKINGFKVASFVNIISYKGKKNENTLISYLSITLQKEKPDTFKIFDELKGLHKIKSEDFSMLKENINKLVRECKKCKTYLNSLDMTDNFNKDLKKFICYSQECIKEFCTLYKEIIFLGDIIKQKFGEANDICDVINNLSSFLLKLEEEHMKLS